MAVVVSDNRNSSYDGNISTANGFYRAESANLAIWGGGTNVSTAQTLAITPANAGNSMGVAVWVTADSTGITKSLICELQENVASVWTTRQTLTKTYNEIILGSTQQIGQGFVVPFKFATPYAVDTTAGKWRIRVSQSTSGSNNWIWRYSSAGNFSHTFWCDNKVSYTSNTDQFVAVDNIYLNQATTLAGALFTGDTATAVAGWISSTTDKSTPITISKLCWSDSPSAGYKVTAKGCILFPSYSGFRAGSSSQRIPIAKMGDLDFADPSAGTTKPCLCSIGNPTSRGNSTGGGQSIFIYGEVPAVEDTELESAVSANSATITTKVETGWNIGDRISIGRMVARGNDDSANLFYTITNISGKTITVTPNVAKARAINASVIRLNGYGFRLSCSNTSGFVEHLMFGYRDFIIEGCEFYNVGFYAVGYGAVPTDSLFPYTLKNCSGLITIASSIGSMINTSGSSYTNSIGQIHDHVNTSGCIINRGLGVGNGQADWSMTNCIQIMGDVRGGNMVMSGKFAITDCKFENILNSGVRIQGWYVTLRRNLFWGNASGASSSQGALIVAGNYLSNDIGDNYFDNNHTSVALGGSNFTTKFTNDNFGTVVTNLYDVYSYYRSLSEITFENYSGNITYGIFNYVLTGANVKFISKNKVAGADEQWRGEGVIYKCGVGLSDTTKHTGNYCMKFSPFQNWSDALTWTQKVPTENIQNKTMMVGVWVNIANSAYWAGSNQMPRLTVNYDNGTIVYAEAAQATGWQFIFVPFTPQTTYGEITVSVSGKTSASTANGIFYVADMSVLYPAGHKIELGAMNTWAGGEPVTPSISTVANAADVMSLSPDLIGAGTIGQVIKTIDVTTNKIQSTTDFIGGA